MTRREFITLVGGAAIAWPLAARAQQAAMPVVGFLSTRASGDDPHLVAAVRRGLRETGFIEGQNVAFEYRFAVNQNDRLPALAADLVRQPNKKLARGWLPSACSRLPWPICRGWRFRPLAVAARSWDRGPLPVGHVPAF